ncbi:MAG: 3-oxoacyl-[acyl-carrier-protein] synthase-1 [Flavobacteriales bacterium]|jgi:3-oxoacyl-[acyl-carrier-protein] synthase-1
MIYIGAENIIAPLGMTAEDAFMEAMDGETSIEMHEGLGVQNANLPAAKFTDEQRAEISIEGERFIVSLAVKCIEGSLDQVTRDLLSSPKTLLLLSTTKGDIELIAEDTEAARLHKLGDAISKKLNFAGSVQTVSNACISGVLAVITASDFIRRGQYDHVIVCGVDLVTPFTIAGFESFFAISETTCRPYDANRDGIALGEGSACICVSSENIYLEEPFTYLGGACANDANHISGPSRTGEGLFRAIKRSIKYAGIKPENISQICAHGTATRYNDDMESLALKRAELQYTPVNSLKGYIGHTLGAAGVMELALLFQSVRNEVILGSLGFEEHGTSETMGIASATMSLSSEIVLKTASGFGGCNAAALFKAP